MLPPPSATIIKTIALIEARTGLNISSQFKADLPALLMQAAGNQIEEYLRRLHQQPEHSAEWQQLLHLLTIGETYFLRDIEHFRLLRQHILPKLTQAKRQQRQLDLTIWCVGCATGEEPYSLAITLQEFLPDLPRWRITILGTDINQRAIEAAQRGQYRRWSFRHTTEAFERRYFEQVDGTARIRPEIQRMVRFQRSNVLDTAPLHECDLIFCRNILLYLNRPSIERVETLLYETLRPSGWLFLGQAEAIRYARERWLLHIFPGTPIYQKPSLSALKSGERVRYEPPAQDNDTPIPAPLVPPTRETSYADAVRAIQQDNPDEAERCLAAVLAQQPTHARAHALLAFIFANRQALPEAQAHLDTALTTEPLLADAHYIRALLHLEQAETAAALEALKSALYCQRQHILAAYLLGTVYAKAGDLPSAYRQWRNARRSLSAYAPDDYISELSDITAKTMDVLLANHLDEA